ncbi:oxidoreductase [Bacillus sp. FJAT-18017]|uniref:molybdopterin-dependent oxidoreductase n=1 Tax=Bacillus sp. FJAT-18017 TaxID=1705566 RepID=UPI0006B045CB|nr:molybdopterin-dependent oxidoreductase [Bacillus sp. FJAT-18017]ALC90444.1 oxidoreductase [Bacillus sp. FJAT-18017]
MTNVLPPGQFETEKWPILHQGEVYKFNEETWRFRLFGEVEQQQTLTYKQVMELPKTTSTIDMHCVTTWSKFATTFEGVALRDFLKLVNVKGDAKYIKIYGYLDGDPEGYSANLPLAPLMGDDSLFVYRWKDEQHGWQDIDPKHGYPLRFIPPASFYLWKGTKWATGIEFLKEDEAGFWEELGYSMSANPFKEERYR